MTPVEKEGLQIQKCATANRKSIYSTRMSMELSNYLVSWVVTYLGDLQPTYIGVIIYLLSSMDIPVASW